MVDEAILMDTLVKSFNAMHGVDNWSNTFQPWGERVICHITIKSTTRSAVGNSEEESFLKAFGYFINKEEKKKVYVLVGWDGDTRTKEILAIKATKEEVQKSDYKFSEFLTTDIYEWVVGEEIEYEP